MRDKKTLVDDPIPYKEDANLHVFGAWVGHRIMW